MTDQPSPWRTKNDAASRAHVGNRTVQRAARSGALRSIKVAGRYLFLDEWVDAWLMSQPSGRGATEAPQIRVAS